jgi:RimJ/RimL family protein N-acetyltransferase
MLTLSTIALITCLQEKGGEKIIGAGRYFAFGDANPPDKAEVSFTVSNDYNSLGIAGKMLRHLAGIAKDMGITAFYAEVLPANTGMLTVFKQSGFPIKFEYESDVTHVTIEIG